MTINIITIGDELLIGQVIDTNSAWIGSHANQLGFNLGKIFTVSDTYESIQDTLGVAIKDAEIVILTGGLGPTKDDISKKAIAEYLGDKLEHSAESWEHIQNMFKSFGREPLDMHREQAKMPSNATLLNNKMGTAMGMWMEYENTIIISLPGVPYEMKYIMENEGFPKLQDRFVNLQAIEHRTLHTVGIGEGQLATMLEGFEMNLPEGLKLAYLPNVGKVRLRLSKTNACHQSVDLDAWTKKMRTFVDAHVFGEGDTSISMALGQLLKDKGLTMGTAESCTGGYISHLITSVSGSSAYFNGSLIAYSNEIKQSQLSVQEKTLEQHGAVSEEVVREMLLGLLEKFNLDVGISISGVAGPTGGTKDKPVGTVWVAVGNKDKIEVRLLNISKSREKNIEYSATRALGMLWHFVRNNY
jgi:nicotinamide-nucleotide amidase